MASFRLSLSGYLEANLCVAHLYAHVLRRLYLREEQKGSWPFQRFRDPLWGFTFQSLHLDPGLAITNGERENLSEAIKALGPL